MERDGSDPLRMQCQKVYKIAYAFSVDDGIHWHRQNTDQLIANSLGEDECQALPTVIKHNGLILILFS